MPDYSRGKIYKIVSPNHPKVYIGSTCTTLKKRFSSHKSDRNCCATEIIDAGDSNIKLIEDFPCLDKYQLEDREAEIQLLDWDGCVNKLVAGAVRRAGGKKAYYSANAEKFITRSKAHYEANRTKINGRRNKKCTCFCGGKYTDRHKAQHRKTKRHQNFVEIISMV